MRRVDSLPCTGAICSAVFKHRQSPDDDDQKGESSAFLIAATLTNGSWSTGTKHTQGTFDCRCRRWIDRPARRSQVHASPQHTDQNSQPLIICPSQQDAQETEASYWSARSSRRLKRKPIVVPAPRVVQVSSRTPPAHRAHVTALVFGQIASHKVLVLPLRPHFCEGAEEQDTSFRRGVCFAFPRMPSIRIWRGFSLDRRHLSLRPGITREGRTVAPATVSSEADRAACLRVCSGNARSCSAQ